MATSKAKSGCYERVPAAEQAARWERSLRPGQYYSTRGGKRPMMHSTVGVVSSPGRTWTQGVDGGAWGPQVKSPIPGEKQKPVEVHRPISPPRRSAQQRAAAMRKIGRLRARTESIFHDLMATIPKLEHISPPNDFKPFPPAFDAGTLRRQVTALQDDVEQRFQYQEQLYDQNMKLWEIVKAMYDNDDWKAAQDEMDRLNKDIEAMQHTVAQLKEQLRKEEGVKAQLQAAKEERDRAAVAMLQAEGVALEMAEALECVRRDNQSLEEELALQTEALTHLQKHMDELRDLQKAEDLEEIQGIAAMVYAKSRSNMRRSFLLLRKAACRSRRLREIGQAFEWATQKVTLKRCLDLFKLNVQVMRMWRRYTKRRAKQVLPLTFRAWKFYVKQQLHFKLAVKRRLLRKSMQAFKVNRQEEHWKRWAEDKVKSSRSKHVLVQVMKVWKTFTARSLTKRAEFMQKAINHYSLRGLRRWVRAHREQMEAMARIEIIIRTKWNDMTLKMHFLAWRSRARAERFAKKYSTRRAFNILYLYACSLMSQRKALHRAQGSWRDWAMMEAMRVLYHHAKYRHGLRHRAKASRPAVMQAKAMSQALRKWKARTTQLRFQRGLVTCGLQAFASRKVVTAMRLWQARTASCVQINKFRWRLFRRQALIKWRKWTAIMQTYDMMLGEATALLRVRTRRLLKHVLTAWWDVKCRSRQEKARAAAVENMLRRHTLRKALHEWCIALTRQAASKTKETQIEKLMQETSLEEEQHQARAVMDERSRVMSRMEELSLEIEKTQGLWEMKIEELRTMQEDKEEEEQGLRALEDLAQEQRLELECLEVQRREDEGKKIMAERERVERETKERFEALDLLDTLMESQRNLKDEHERSINRVEGLRQELEAARARDEKSLRDAQEVADQYETFAANKNKELQQLMRERSDIGIRIKEVERRLEQVSSVTSQERASFESVLRERQAKKAVLQARLVEVQAKGDEALRMAKERAQEVLRLRQEVARLEEEEDVHEVLVSPHRRSRSLRDEEPDGLEKVHRKVMGASEGGGGHGRGKENRGRDRRRDGLDGNEEVEAPPSMEDSMRFYEDLQQSIEELQSRILRRIGEERCEETKDRC